MRKMKLNARVCRFMEAALVVRLVTSGVTPRELF